MRHPWRVVVGAVTLSLTVAACGSADGGANGGEVEITCEACPTNPTAEDTFGQYRKQLWEAFNERYKGRFRVKPTPYTPANDADAVQHYTRAATTGTLPDLFTTFANLIVDLGRTGKLVDFTQPLDQDGTWKGSIRPESFTSLTDASGHIWGLPEQRDAVGIFYNKKLFAAAGVTEFPKTWDEFLSVCAKLKDSGVIPMAMDGDWTTQLMWANLIGTEPGGAEFLQSGIKNGGFADNPTVVAETEFLRRLHTDGFVNKDAFTGDYNRAAAPVLDGQAAMIANGPWMAPNLKDASIDAGYAPSPGSGVIVLAGSAGWASGAKDAGRREAVTAFMKFMTSDDQMYRKAVTTGSYWPTTFTPTPDQVEKLEPLGYQMFQEADRATYTYPHAKFATPPAFTVAWTNNWPAFVQGDMSAAKFLDALSQAVD